jgi:toxin ParE1/3/4
MKLQWSQRALNDVVHLRDYIAQDSPFYARQFTERLINRIENLLDFPRMGRLVPEAEKDDIRELIYQGYRIIYHLNESQNRIDLISILHDSRDIGSMAMKPWDES